jgi:exosome complex exonuclease DIS3/RRP44
MAGRASVEFYVGLALKARGKRAGRDDGGVTREDAFVIRVFKNGLAVFVPTWVSFSAGCVSNLPLIDVDHFDRLGLEGLITFSKDSHEYDAEQYQLAVPNSEGNKVDISVFDTVVVDISLEKDKQTQRSKVKMALVSPADSEQL